jgi:hypothetical protein
MNQPIELPDEIVSRLDLLLFILNKPTPPDVSILEYSRGSQTDQIYEAYWDIAFALGLVDKYESNKNHHMYNGNIKTIRSMDDVALMANPLQYLEQRTVNMNISGECVITAVYNNVPEIDTADPCVYSPQVQSKKPKLIFCSSITCYDVSKKIVNPHYIQHILYTGERMLNIDIDYKMFDYKIVILVRNDTVLKNKILTELRLYLSEEASAVYGFDDLLIMLRKIYDLSKQCYGQSSVTKENIHILLKCT